MRTLEQDEIRINFPSFALAPVDGGKYRTIGEINFFDSNKLIAAVLKLA